MSTDVEVIVVGAGAVGLAIARAEAMAGREVLVLEANDRIGAETSARNSEVIHAGIYYTPGSLKARFCVAGKQLLYEFCGAHGVTAEPVGKLLVAIRDEERGKLARLRNNARANGVDDLECLDAAAARRLEPEIRCVAACLSPSTGVVDSHGFMHAVEGHLQSLGGAVVLNTRVNSAAHAGDHFRVDTTSDGSPHSISCRRLINAAGHGARAIVSAMGFADHYLLPIQRFARGHYYRATPAPRVSRLVYPMPSGSWLGTHLSLDVGGGVKFGPDLDWIDELDYDFDDSEARRTQFIEAIRQYWPPVADCELQPDYTGVRPKIYGPGEPVPDFAIHGQAEHGIPGLVCLFGIESPGLTSSLAIADYVTRL